MQLMDSKRNAHLKNLLILTWLQQILLSYTQHKIYYLTQALLSGIHSV